MTSETKTSAKSDPADGKFEILQLTKNQFDNLLNKPKRKSVLVFQFSYPFDFSPGQSPGLIAYIMYTGHKEVGIDAFEKLSGTGNMSAEPIYNREQVLGDLQIDVLEVKALIKEATGSENGNYSALIFTPFFDSSIKHICYKITVDQPALVPTSKVANPSPPRSAL